MSGFPVELWMQVLSDIDPLQHRQTLLALCLTSKTLFEVARPLLYSVLTAEDLRKQSVLFALGDSTRGNWRAGCVREVFTECRLVAERDGEFEADRPWTEEELHAAQAKTMASWDRTVSALKDCTSVTKLHFSLDCFEGTERPGANALANGQDIYESVPMPSEDSLLSLPFLDTLRELSIESPNATEDTSYRSFGALILACPQLSKLSLRLVIFGALFEPILDALTFKPGQVLALEHVEWDERQMRDDMEAPDCFDEILPLLAKLPSLRRITFAGDNIHAEYLCSSHLQSSLRIPQVNHVTLLDDALGHSGDEHHLFYIINLYFPALATLTISVEECELYGTVNTTFSCLQDLTVIDHHQYVYVAAPVFLKLLHHSFSPNLSTFRYHPKWLDSDNDAERQLLDEQRYWLGCDFGSFGTDLSSIELQHKGRIIRLRRQKRLGFAAL